MVLYDTAGGKMVQKFSLFVSLNYHGDVSYMYNIRTLYITTL